MVKRQQEEPNPNTLPARRAFPLPIWEVQGDKYVQKESLIIRDGQEPHVIFRHVSHDRNGVQIIEPSEQEKASQYDKLREKLYVECQTHAITKQKLNSASQVIEAARSKNGSLERENEGLRLELDDTRWKVERRERAYLSLRTKFANYRRNHPDVKQIGDVWGGDNISGDIWRYYTN